MLHTIDPQNLSIWHVHCNGTRLEEFRPLPSSDSEKCHFRHISSYIQPMFINPTAMHQVLQIPVTIDTMVGKILQIQITAWMASYLAAMCLCVCQESHQPLCPPCSSSSLKIESQKQKRIKIGKTRRVTHGTTLKHQKNTNSWDTRGQDDTRWHPWQHEMSFAEFLTSMGSWALTSKANLSSELVILSVPIFCYLVPIWFWRLSKKTWKNNIPFRKCWETWPLCCKNWGHLLKHFWKPTSIACSPGHEKYAKMLGFPWVFRHSIILIGSYRKSLYWPTGILIMAYYNL